MGSKREVERNEKIIRGLMKLPPNRRCINCNSLGPQYVCTNFWTFVCMPCSGVHREFTHRVKSVSMAKFNVQEVDALQKGGNQRARELFLKAWDPQRQRLPDNSNPDKVREFIKYVYVDKRYAIEKLSDKPPIDRQSLSHEDETRKASSYHSYSQSPPYDFQYEERRYGKPVSSLSRKPGSDHALYDGKLSSFSSPGRSSDQANDERFANDGSWPRVSDYSVSSGGDAFRSGVFSPSSHRETWSPFSESETSSSFSSDLHGHHTYSHNSNSQGGSRRGHPQRTASSGSFGSFDSMSFKSVNSTGLQEVVSEAQKTVDMPLEKATSFPSLPKSSPSTVFNGLDLFNEPFASQNTTYTPKNDCNSQSPESFSSQPLDLFQQPISSSSTLTEKQPLEILKPSPLNFTAVPQQESIASLSDKTSEVAVLQKGGWATFDVSQNLLNMGSQDSIPAALPSSDGNNLQCFHPFSLVQGTSSLKPPTVELAASTHTPWHDSLQTAETTRNDTQFWNAFEDYPGKESIDYALKVRDQTPALYSNDNISLGGGGYEVLRSGGNFTTSYGIESPTSMALHNFPLVTEAAGVHPVATVHNHTNPFDLPCEVDVESNNTFWGMSSLQAALPSNQPPATYVADANESWFPQNSVPPYIPGGVAFDTSNAGPLGYIVGQAPSTQIPNGPAQGPFASVGGNPFRRVRSRLCSSSIITSKSLFFS